MPGSGVPAIQSRWIASMPSSPMCTDRSTGVLVRARMPRAALLACQHPGHQRQQRAFAAAARAAQEQGLTRQQVKALDRQAVLARLGPAEAQAFNAEQWRLGRRTHWLNHWLNHRLNHRRSFSILSGRFSVTFDCPLAPATCTSIF